MNVSELVVRIAARTGIPESRVRQVLRAEADLMVEALAQGDKVSLHGVGTICSRWRPAAQLRAIGDRRKVRIDGRWVARFRPAARLRGVLLARTPQLWRDPAHQAAWRVAETLIGDLALYHAAKAPAGLAPDADPAAVDEACLASFGPIWTRCRATWDGKVPPEVRAATDYLCLAARARWALPQSP